MEKDDFRERLARATRETLDFTRKFVVDDLPNAHLYVIIPNKHGQGKAFVGDAEVYPEDTLPEGEFLGPISADDAISYLWRNSKVPEWINISVDTVEGDFTIVKLWCCGHFTSLPANGFNAMVDSDFAGHTPFAIRSPALPKKWKEGDAKFKLDEAPRFF